MTEILKVKRECMHALIYYVLKNYGDEEPVLDFVKVFIAHVAIAAILSYCARSNYSNILIAQMASLSNLLPS